MKLDSKNSTIGSCPSCGRKCDMALRALIDGVALVYEGVEEESDAGGSNTESNAEQLESVLEQIIDRNRLAGTKTSFRHLVAERDPKICAVYECSKCSKYCQDGSEFLLAAVSVESLFSLRKVRLSSS